MLIHLNLHFDDIMLIIYHITLYFHYSGIYTFKPKYTFIAIDNICVLGNNNKISVFIICHPARKLVRFSLLKCPSIPNSDVVPVGKNKLQATSHVKNYAYSGKL